MSSANDNPGPPRLIRDALQRQWTKTQQIDAAVCSDTLERISVARNGASKFSNVFMLVSAAFCLVYFVRLGKLADKLKISEYTISDLPFGLFLSTLVSLLFSCLMMLRIGDSRAFDRQLLAFCEKSDRDSSFLVYHSFPNENAWGEQFSHAANAAQIGQVGRFFRGMSFSLISLIILTLTMAPFVVGYDYLANGRYKLEGGFETTRFSIISLFLFVNFFTYITLWWVRLIDRDR